jgi:hypothetical protein
MTYWPPPAPPPDPSLDELASPARRDGCGTDHYLWLSTFTLTGAIRNVTFTSHAAATLRDVPPERRTSCWEKEMLQKRTGRTPAVSTNHSRAVARALITNHSRAVAAAGRA